MFFARFACPRIDKLSLNGSLIFLEEFWQLAAFKNWRCNFKAQIEWGL